MTATNDAPVSARRLQTRQRLMDAAVRVFAERGIEGASVEEISEAAGFTRGAFYSNFDSKDDLCFALLRWIAGRFLDSVRVTVERISEKTGTGDDATVTRGALIEGASVEEISEAAGFTRGAFYSNFDSKDDLCFALLRWIAGRFLDSVRVTVERISEKTGTGDDATVTRGALIDLAVDTFLAIQPQERHTMLLLMEMQLYALRHPDFAAAYSAHNARTHQVFAEVLDEALAQRGLALSLPADQVVDILHGVHDYTQVSCHIKPDRANPLAGQLKILLNALVRER